MKRTVSILLVALCLIVGGTLECNSRESHGMLVARTKGDIFLPAISAAAWNADGSIDCELASQQFSHESRPPREDDLLLCGETSLRAWSLTWLRPDVKDQIYRVAVKETVNFHNAGHSRGYRDFHHYWNCRKTSGLIECD